MPDLLPRVLLTPAAVLRWQQVIDRTVRQFVQDGFRPDFVPDELADMVEGKLRIYCSIPGSVQGRAETRLVELLLEADEWTWNSLPPSTN